MKPTLETISRAWLLLLVIPALVPLFSPHPPFQDWPGHLAIAGGLIHLGDPEANVSTFFEHRHWVGLNGSLYLLIFALAQVFPPDLAADLVLALSLGAIGPAALVLCRAAGADPRLALLSLPIAFARPTYAGFIPNMAATAMLIALLASYLEHQRAPRPHLVVAQVALQIALALTHTFIALVGFALIALWAALDIRTARRAAIAGLASAAGGALVLALLLPGERLTGFLPAFLAADRLHPVSDFWSWLIAFRGGTIADDLLQIAWLAPIAALIALRREWSLPQRRLGAALLAVLLAFLAIPMELGEPVGWWGARGRLPVVAVLLALPLIPPDRFRPARWAAALAAVVVAIYAFVELAVWERTVMPGFGDALRELPEGRAISVLWYDVDAERRFPGAPLGHAGGWYVLEKGGASAQVLSDPSLPLVLARPIAAPPWGMAELFDWNQHRTNVEIFLVRPPEEGSNAPFYGDHLEALPPPRSSGAWRYWTE